MAEPGSELVRSSMDNASQWSICRIGFVEVIRAVHLETGKRGTARVRAEWPRFAVVDVDQKLVDRAAALAESHRLRSLDALHLAAALLLPPENLTMLTWDRRLHAAARDHGLAVSPDAID